MPSLPGNFNYPTFPEHGLPRIVTTLGLLSISIAIAIWILVAIGTSSTGSTEFRSNDNSRSGAGTTGNKLTHSSRERGFQAGFDYGLRDKNAIKGKNPKQRGVKKLAAQIAGKQREDPEWQLGWIDGYNKALAPAAAHNANAVDQYATKLRYEKQRLKRSSNFLELRAMDTSVDLAVAVITLAVRAGRCT